MELPAYMQLHLQGGKFIFFYMFSMLPATSKAKWRMVKSEWTGQCDS
jgi:hypothetical protein